MLDAAISVIYNAHPIITRAIEGKSPKSAYVEAYFHALEWLLEEAGQKGRIIHVALSELNELDWYEAEVNSEGAIIPDEIRDAS